MSSITLKARIGKDQKSWMNERSTLELKAKTWTDERPFLTDLNKLM